MPSELPASIARDLATPAVAGERHHQMCHLVKAMLGAGWSSEEVFQQFRSMYNADKTDREIRSVIKGRLKSASCRKALLLNQFCGEYHEGFAGLVGRFMLDLRTIDSDCTGR